MLYSQLFGKTTKTVPQDASNASTKLLNQAGYIRESTAGRMFFLPLGWRVMQKIMKVVKEEMDAIGSQEMVVPTLHPLELWKETNRTNTTAFELMTVKDRRGAEFALGGTAEEMFVDVVRKFTMSYRDLPFHVYQFSTKFRDELRARGGLLRVREFIMKDAYSFDTDETTFRAMYQMYWDAYIRIYQRLGLTAQAVEADNGYIGGEYCHEFIVESPVGESKYLVTPDGSYAAHEDVARFRRDAANADEEIRPLKTIDQPAWVQTMEHNVKHYGKPANHYLKNVVYKNRITGEIIIAVVTGDLEVNRTKLETVLHMVGQLEDATVDDLAKIGTKPGYVHSWGHKGVRYVGDIVLTQAHNLIGGQKENTTDTVDVNYGRDFTCEVIADIALAHDGYMSEDGQKLTLKKGIEVGNIFQLGLHYSTLMKDATYTDRDGKKVPYYMGCYGIGVGRTLATAVEIHHDDRGIVWPESIAPYRVALIGLDLNDENIKQKAGNLYDLLREKLGDEILYDDRVETRAGEKFADADLIGIPTRLVISKRTGDQVEVKMRNEKESKLMDLNAALDLITSK